MRYFIDVAALGLLLCYAIASSAQPATLFNVKNFGAVPATVSVRIPTPSTRPSTAADDAGGGTVLVPAGAYVSGTIQLQNNVTLWIDAGATILGTKNLADYHWPEGGREWDGSIILANGVHNVALMGRGTINGQNLRIRGARSISAAPTPFSSTTAKTSWYATSPSRTPATTRSSCVPASE